MTYQQKDRGLGALALAGTSFLWSLAGLLIKLVDWNPFAIACGRSVVAPYSYCYGFASPSSRSRSRS